MANTFLTPDVVAREALVLLQSNLVGTRLFSRRYEAELNGTAKVGETIRVRRRGAGTVDEYNGSTVTIRDITETSIPMALEKHFDATIKITDRERTMSLMDFSEQVLAPRIVAMGEKIDQYCLSKIKNLPNVAGPSESAPATIPTSISDWALCDKTLNDLKIPLFPRYGIISTLQKATILSQDSFVEVDKSGTSDALRAASIGRIMGFDMFMGQNVDTATFTSGTQTSALTNGPLAAGATSIVYDGGAVGAGVINAGDILVIGGYGQVVAAASSTAVSGAGTVTIVEPLREAVADNTSFTIYDGGGNGRKNHGALFHPDAFAFVSVPLDLPTGTPASYIRDEASGLSLRAVYDYDRNLKSDVLSIDCLVGAKMVDGRLGAQLVANV